MLSPLAYWFILFGVASYAFGRGRWDERLVAAVCVLGSIATVIVRSPINQLYSDVELGIFVVDTVALGGFIVVALRSSRFWPLWVAGFQLTSVLAHFLKAIHWDLIPQVYAAAERFWIYPIFLVIVVGTWRGRSRWQQETEKLAQPA